MDDFRIHSYRVSEQAVSEYENSLKKLLAMVDKGMTLLINDKDLIGTNPLSVMYDNHHNHAKLLLTVLTFNDFNMLENILPWVIRNYSIKGFTEEYFSQVLSQWQNAITKYLTAPSAGEILPVYRWMASKVEYLYRNSEVISAPAENAQSLVNNIRDSRVRTFTGLLVTGKHDESMDLIMSLAKNRESLKEIYTDIIRPSMYEIGGLWETDKISVAHEHLATSIILRIITHFYSDFVYTEPTKGKILVTAAADEHHEVGARMIADLLEMEGWDVSYLGADIPTDDLIRMLDSVRPDILSISVTMAFNLLQVKDLITAVRRKPRFNQVKILVGGHALIHADKARNMLGADRIGMTAVDTLKIMTQWWEEEIQ
ncbi:MAG: cobalamin B12-binding domain-containing protein [Sphaerochaetaceae bacterium]